MTRRDLLIALGLLALAIPALGPLLGPGLVQSNDVASHLYRVVCLDEALRAGVVYPRWFPQMAYGYGYALPNYFSPLSYYLAEAFHLLGLGFVAAAKLAFAGGFLLAGLGMYALARELFTRERSDLPVQEGPPSPLRGGHGPAQPGDGGGVIYDGRWAAASTSLSASLVAAGAYAYLPYAWVDVYARGTLAESLAIALVPATLWAITRLVRTGSRSTVLLVAVLFAALVLTHNVTAFLFLPVAAVYVAFLTRHASRVTPHTSRFTFYVSRLTPLLLSLLLALALSAFYWLPALAEKSLVLLDQRTTGYYDVRNQLLPLWNLVQLTPAYDYRTPSPQVGLVQAVLFALALPNLVWGMRGRRGSLLFFALLALGAMLFVTSVTEVFWVYVPLVSYVWFPWRLLAFAGLGTALLTGTLAHPAGWPARLASRLVLRLRRRELFRMGMGHLAPQLTAALTSDQATQLKPVMAGDPERILRQAQRARPLAAAGVGLAVLVAVVLSTALDLRPDYWAFENAATIPALHRVEYNTQTLGLTVASEYLPATVGENPTQMPRGDLLSRGIDAGPVPDLTLVVAEPFTWRAFTLADSPGGPVVLHQFAFPGWSAWVDDQPVPVEPTGSLGLARVDVPPGEHRVSFRFTDTPTRAFAGLLSLIGLLGLVGVSIRPRTRREVARSGMILLLTLILLFALTGDRNLVPRRFVEIVESPLWPKSSIQHHPVDFGPGMRLLGYQLDKSRLNTDRELDVTLYWQARQPLTTSHVVDVGLATEAKADHGVLAVHRGVPGHGVSPTTKWEVGEIVVDRRTLRLVRGAPSGIYWLAVAVRQAPEGPYVEVAPGEMVAWLQEVGINIPPDPVQTPQHERYVPLQGILELEGFDTEPTFADDTLAAQPGQVLVVTPHWRAADAWVPYDYTIRLTLRDASGAVAHQVDYSPVYDVPATSLWSLDQRAAPRLSFPLPAHLAPGEYVLECELYHGFDEQRIWPLRTSRAAFDLFTIRVQ